MAKTSVLTPKRGEVYLVDLDPARGAEIQKTRPALVVQNDIDNRHNPRTEDLGVRCYGFSEWAHGPG